MLRSRPANRGNEAGERFSSWHDWCCSTESGGVSNGGRFVAFNAGEMIFVRDTIAGTTEAISRDLTTGGSATAREPVISGNGRYVLFRSTWWNVVAGDGADSNDLFLYDRLTKQTLRISNAPVRTWNEDFHPIDQQRWTVVSFVSRAKETPDDVNPGMDAFLWDRLAGHTRLVSVSASGVQSDGFTSSSSVSDDRAYVAFTSDANNLAPGGEPRRARFRRVHQGHADGGARARDLRLAGVGPVCRASPG